MSYSKRIFELLCGVILAASAAAAAQRGPAGGAPLIQTGATERVSEHVYVIPDDEVRFVPNVGIVVGDRATLVVDTGLGPRNGEIIMGEVERISSNDELFIVSTHFHPEHALGEAGFPSTATVVRARSQQTDIDELGLELASAFAGFSEANAELLEGARFRPADVLFERDTTLDLGGVRVRILARGPTHTRGDTMMFVEGDGVLFAGDVVMNRRFLGFNSDDSSLEVWLDSLAELEGLGATTVVPSHGAVGDGGLIGMSREYLEAVRGAVRALKGQGLSADETVRQVTARIQAEYADWTGGGNAIGTAARIAYSEAD